MKSPSYSPYIRDHGSRIWSTYGSSIDIFFTIFPMNWRTRRATLANSSASRSHPQPKYMHQNVSICQTSAAICAAVRELNRCVGMSRPSGKIQPFTHHEILGLIEPFVRSGRHVDLASSDRINRCLMFKPVEHSSEGGRFATIQETLQL